MINAAPLNVCLILQYHLFFRKDFFSNVYISVNTIIECSYLPFGWEIGRLLRSKQLGEGVIQNVRWSLQAKRVITSHVYVCTYTIYFHVFVLFLGAFFYLQKFKLTLIQKGCACQKWLFFLNEMPFFERILCSVAWRFISEIVLHRYLQSLFYTIVIAVVTVT